MRYFRYIDYVCIYIFRKTHMEPPQRMNIFHDFPIEESPFPNGINGSTSIEAAEAKLITLVERIRGAATAKARWNPGLGLGIFLRMAH